MVAIGCKRIILVLIILVFFTVSAVSAINVELQPVPNSQSKEGEIIDYQMIITGIPQQTSFIVLETDLEPYNSTPLWNVSDASEHGIGNSSSDVMKRKIQITPSVNLASPIIVAISGKVPSIKQVSPVNGVVFCNARTTGYRYYTVQPYDATGYAVGNGDTKTFNIHPESPCIPPDDSGVTDPELKKIIHDHTDKGLWQESNELIDYSKAQPITVPLHIYIISILIIGFLVFFVGMKIGGDRVRKQIKIDDEF